MSAAAERPAGILRLAAPLVVSFWLRAAFAWIDPIFAAGLEDAAGTSIADESLAAIGLTIPFDFLMIAFWVGTSNGLTARLAAAMGAGEGAKVEQLKKAALRVIYGLCAVFLVLAAAIWLFAERVGLDPVVARQFRIFATVLLSGSAFTSFWSVLPDSIVKAHQDTRSTMWAGLLSSSCNAALNALFVFAFHWGIFGIALATVLGRLAGLVYAWRRAAWHEERRRAAGRDLQPDLFERPIRAILVIAVPSGATYALMSVETQAANFLLGKLPDSTALLAAWSIFDRAVRFMAMPVIAGSVAMLPLVAWRWSRRDAGGVRAELRAALLASLAYGLFFAAPVVFLFGAALASGLAETELSRQYARHSLYFLPLAVLGMSPMLLIRAAFDGMQQPRIGLIVSTVRAALLVLPLVFLGIELAPRLGLSRIAGASAGYCLGVSVASLLLAAWMRRFLRNA